MPFDSPSGAILGQQVNICPHTIPWSRSVTQKKAKRIDATALSVDDLLPGTPPFSTRVSRRTRRLWEPQTLAEAEVPLEAADEATCEAFLQADRQLVDRCLAGEVAAWEDLYAQCHQPLCSAIRIMLGRPHVDLNLVDEIAARVWYAVVAKDGEMLARYAPGRGARLITFFCALARDEIGRHFRAEIRRRNRELSGLRERPRSGQLESAYSAIGLQEFLSTLTPQERVFCCEVLLAEPGPGGETSRSGSNIWQLTHRVFQKLQSFLARGW
jgi:hypothetical protein